MYEFIRKLALKFNKSTNKWPMAISIGLISFFIINLFTISALFNNYKKYSIVIFLLFSLILIFYYFFLICIKVSYNNTNTLSSFDDILLVVSAFSVVASIMHMAWSADIDGLTLFIYLFEDIYVFYEFIICDKEGKKAAMNNLNNLNNDINKDAIQLIRDELNKLMKKYVSKHSNKDKLKDTAYSAIDSVIKYITNDDDDKKFSNLLNTLIDKDTDNDKKKEIMSQLEEMYKEK